MKSLHSITLLFPLAAAVIISGCNSGGGGLKGDDNSVERVARAPAERGCIPINAEGNEALARDVFGLDLDAVTLLDPDGMGPLQAQTITEFLAANEGKLGGRGVEATRDASIGYFRSATHYSHYLCEALVRGGNELVQDSNALAQAVWGGSLDSEELADLAELEATTTSGNDGKIASCTVILSALETQCVN